MGARREKLLYGHTDDYFCRKNKAYETLHLSNLLPHLLTSSTRTPKFISKQWSDTLMPFHKHSPIDSLLALRQCHLYSHYSFSKFEHLVHTHIYPQSVISTFVQTLWPL